MRLPFLGFRLFEGFAGLKPSFPARRARAAQIDGGKGENAVGHKNSASRDSKWLAENGPKELESLLRSVIYQPSATILIADDSRKYRDASASAGKLLGLTRDAVIGRQLDDFTPPGLKPQVSQLWRAFLKQGEQEGVLQLEGPDGSQREVEYIAKSNVLPVQARPGAAR